ncbi:MAG: ribokinase [Spirochaetales bacterium]|uniref:Ribokinase n=1 Tax=Candidatus Thalassospirochaeta sargassi TaxID=3119039 RepID=A0AAJ1IB22_9SPIO|nr:ribokinase [Spirochaetales bacterium]
MNNRITVLGSFVVDLMGRADHLPLPGETVLGSSFKMGPGGKGSNQAAAAHRAGGNVVFITKLGRDLFSSIAREFYASEGMNTDYLFEDADEPTGTALILVDEKTSQNSILVNPGACENISPENMSAAEEVISSSSILLTQLETNIDVLEPAVKAFRSKTSSSLKNNLKTAILNPAPVRKIGREILSLFDIITPNEVEASILSGIEVTDFSSAEKAADYFIESGVETVIITMGEQGCFIKNSSITETVPAFHVEAIDTTGAGDAFNGGLAAALASGKSIVDAAVFATATAALSVTKIGTAPAMPHIAEIEEKICSNQPG